MQSFQPVIVRDSRVNDISTILPMRLDKGPAQSNYQQYPSTNANANNMSFNNINIPSENTIIDRHVTITATPTIRMSFTNFAANKRVFYYGTTDAFQNFPLNSSFLSNSYTINGCTSTIMTQDLMSPLLTMTDDEQLRHYNCPTLRDKNLKHFGAMVLQSSNPLADYRSVKKGFIPRGSHPITFTIQRIPNGTLPADVAALPIITELSTDGEIEGALTSLHVGDVINMDITTTFTEPLLFCSPFTYGASNNNNAGLFGVNKMAFNMQLDSSCKRMFSSSINVGAGVRTIQLIDMKKCEINFNFLTSQTSDLIANKNVLPFTDYFRYETTGQVAIPANTSSGTLVTNSIQMASIPDKIYICVRPANLTIADSNSFLPIEKLTVNFNNVNGIFAGASPMDLYNMSVSNGSKQELYEFLGYANGENGRANPSTGSLIVIKPTKNLNLLDFLTNGSQGQFNLAVNLVVKNNEPVNGVAITPVITIIVENNGIFVTENSQSSKFTSLFTKDMVTSESLSQFGESENYIKSFDKDMLINNSGSLKNIPLLNYKNKVVGGAYSGGGQKMTHGSMLANVV